MRNETELVIDINRAKAAHNFINNPLFIEGIAILKASTLDKFESLDFTATAEMVDCNRMLKVIDSFESIYTNIILTGNAAEMTLIEKQAFDKEMSK